MRRSPTRFMPGRARFRTCVYLGIAATPYGGGTSLRYPTRSGQAGPLPERAPLDNRHLDHHVVVVAIAEIEILERNHIVLAVGECLPARRVVRISEIGVGAIDTECDHVSRAPGFRHSCEKYKLPPEDVVSSHQTMSTSAPNGERCLRTGAAKWAQLCTL